MKSSIKCLPWAGCCALFSISGEKRFSLLDQVMSPFVNQYGVVLSGIFSGTAWNVGIVNRGLWAWGREGGGAFTGKWGMCLLMSYKAVCVLFFLLLWELLIRKKESHSRKHRRFTGWSQSISQSPIHLPVLEFVSSSELCTSCNNWFISLSQGL